MDSSNESVGYEIPTEVSRIRERRMKPHVQGAFIAVFVGIICLTILVVSTLVSLKKIDSAKQTTTDENISLMRSGYSSNVIRSASEKTGVLQDSPCRFNYFQNKNSTGNCLYVPWPNAICFSNNSVGLGGNLLVNVCSVYERIIVDIRQFYKSDTTNSRDPSFDGSMLSINQFNKLLKKAKTIRRNVKDVRKRISKHK